MKITRRQGDRGYSGRIFENKLSLSFNGSVRVDYIMSKITSMEIGKNATGDKKLNKVLQLTALGNPGACFPLCNVGYQHE